MENLKNELIKMCNESGLPLEALYFVVKDLFRDVETTFIQAKEQLSNKLDEEEEMEETEDDN